MRRLAAIASLLLLAACVPQARSSSVMADLNEAKFASFKAQKDAASNKEAIDALQAEVARLKQASSNLPSEQSLSAMRASQTSLYNQVSEVVRELQAITETLDRTKYDLEKRMKQVEADVDVAKSAASDAPKSAAASEIDTVRKRLDVVEAQLASLRGQAVPVPDENNKKPSAPAALSADDAYKAAYDAFDRKEYAKARSMMQAFLKDYPDNRLTDNALFWIGETYYNEAAYDRAILSYEEVIKKRPDSNKAPDAMLKQAYAFINIGDKVSAKGLLSILIDKYPQSNAAANARKKIKSLQ